MRIVLASILITLLATNDAFAGSEPCREPAPTATFDPRFLEHRELEMPISTLIKFLYGFTCKPIVVEASARGELPSVVIYAPTKLTMRRAYQLLVDAIETTGLVVEVKRDAVRIKRGPDMPTRAAHNAPPSFEEDLVAFLAANVKKLDVNHYEISLALRNEIGRDAFFFASAVRFTALTEAGTPKGFQIDRIHPASLLAVLGFKNGDKLQAINGKVLTDEVGAELIRDVLQHSRVRELAIDVVRAGKRLRVTVDVLTRRS